MSSAGPSGVEKRGSAATVRACDTCRRRKRRCKWAPGANSCTPCLQIKEECTTTHVRKPRSKPQKRDRIAEYESRIQRLEALLKERSEAQPQVQEQPLQRPDDQVHLSTLVDNVRNEAAAFPSSQAMSISPLAYEGGLGPIDPERILTDPSLDPSSTEDPLDDLFEPSAEFQEDAAILQDPSFQPSSASASMSNLSISPAPVPRIPTACEYSLPPPELGTSLLAEFLVDFNTVYPLYRPYAIAEHLRVCYAGGSDGTPLAWASVYVVLGIAHRSRAMSAVATPQDNAMADFYIARILPTVSGLLLAPPSLGLVQCLLGVAMLIRTSSYSTPHVLFVSTALRIAQSLAYNDDQHLASTTASVSASEDSDADIEQQRRVFWLAFIQDTDESILSNLPTSHRREDITTSIPDENPEDSLGAVKAAEGNWTVNLFSLRARLALIQAWAIEQVFSIKARNKSVEELTAATHSLLGRLREWHRHELFQLNVQELQQLLYRSDFLHVLTVEASYFATEFRLHGFLALGMDPRVNPFSADALTQLANQKEHNSFKDAQRLLSLLAVAPQGDVGICWMTKLPIIAALVTVLAHHLHYPNETPPSSDSMREYSRILRMLSTLIEKRPDFEVQKMRDLCMVLFSRVETGLRVSWLNNVVDEGELGSA